jgi:hypothetical protein
MKCPTSSSTADMMNFIKDNYRLKLSDASLRAIRLYEIEAKGKLIIPAYCLSQI